MKYRTRLLGLAASAGLLASLTATAASVPPHVAARAGEIAKGIGGSGTTVVQVERLEDQPGLSQATLVKYRDAVGRESELIMLPDGKHFIPGGVFEWKGASAKSPAPQPLTPKTPAPKPASASMAYERNDILDPADFSASVIEELFEARETAPVSYFSILQDAPAVVDGTGSNHVYVMFDPACGYCLRKYEGLRPLIDQGSITVHWIPVIGPSKAPYNALMALADTQATNEQRLERLHALASRQRIQVEVDDVEGTKRVLAKTNALRQMLRSSKSPNRAAGTPQSFYALPNGEIRHHYGYNDFQVEQVRADFDI